MATSTALQLQRTAQLLLIAFLVAAIYLRPIQPRVEEQRHFYRLWWEAHPEAIAVNIIDSVRLWSLPVSPACKKSWQYRLNKHWPIRSVEQLRELPGMDTLWVSEGQFSFDLPPKPRRPSEFSPQMDVSKSRASSYPKEQASPELIRDTVEVRRIARVDVNEADSLDLVGLPGIGGWTAKAILDERAKYGYIANQEQLKQLWPFRDRWQVEWDTLLVVQPRTPELSLARSTVEELRAFPGLRFKQVHKIAFYRENFGAITWEELARWPEFEGIDLNFLKYYISE